MQACRHHACIASSWCMCTGGSAPVAPRSGKGRPALTPKLNGMESWGKWWGDVRKPPVHRSRIWLSFGTVPTPRLDQGAIVILLMSTNGAQSLLCCHKPNYLTIGSVHHHFARSKEKKETEHLESLRVNEDEQQLQAWLPSSEL